MRTPTTRWMLAGAIVGIAGLAVLIALAPVWMDFAVTVALACGWCAMLEPGRGTHKAA